MEITNRSIAVLMVVTVLLIGGAAWLTFSPRGVNQLFTGGGVLGKTVDDDKAPFLGGEARPMMPFVMREGATEVTQGGAMVVTKARDLESETAHLNCHGAKSIRTFDGRNTIFPDVPVSGCSLKLDGAKRSYSPVFPLDRLECHIDEERDTVCEGGLAQERAGTVTVRAETAASLAIDGVDAGALPLEELKLNVGHHDLTVTLTDGRSFEWRLDVRPDEMIDITFPTAGEPATTTQAATAPASATPGTAPDASPGHANGAAMATDL